MKKDKTNISNNGSMPVIVIMVFILSLLCGGILSFRSRGAAEANGKNEVTFLLMSYRDDCIRGNVENLSSYYSNDSDIETDVDVSIRNILGDNSDIIMNNEEIRKNQRYSELVAIKDLIVENVEVVGNKAEASIRICMLDVPKAGVETAGTQLDNVLSEDEEDNKNGNDNSIDSSTLDSIARMSSVTAATLGYTYMEEKLELTKINGEWKITNEYEI